MPHQGTTVAGPRPPCSGWIRAGPVVESQPPFGSKCLRKKLQPPTDRIPTSSATNYGGICEPGPGISSMIGPDFPPSPKEGSWLAVCVGVLGSDHNSPTGGEVCS